MPFYNPFIQDEDELLAQDPVTAANMAPPVATPPPQDNNQAIPPQMMPPDYLKQESIFDNPDFKMLQQMVNRKPSPEEQARRDAEDSDMRTRSMFSNLAAIATGGRPTPSAELDKLIYEKRRHQDDDKINKYKTLLDMYGNVQTSQNNAAQKKLTTLNTYLDTVPGSPKAKQNLPNFQGYLNMMKGSLGLSSKQMGLGPEDIAPIAAEIDSYAKNADKMSYAEQEKARANIKQSVDQVLNVGRSVGMSQQGMQNFQLKGIENAQDRELKERALNLHAFDSSENRALRRDLAERAEADRRSKLDAKLGEDEQKRTDKMSQLAVDELTIRPDMMPSSQDAKKISDAKQSLDVMNMNIDEMKRMVRDKGIPLTTFTDAGSKASGLLTDLRLQAKELYRLGVLNGPDLDLLSKVFPENVGPTAYAKELFQKHTGDKKGLEGQLDEVQKRIKEGFVRAAEAHKYDASDYRKKHGLPQRNINTAKMPSSNLINQAKDALKLNSGASPGLRDAARKALREAGMVPEDYEK